MNVSVHVLCWCVEAAGSHSIKISHRPLCCSVLWCIMTCCSVLKRQCLDQSKLRLVHRRSLHQQTAPIHLGGGQRERAREYDALLLEHTATHCHTLQHTSTHCNTLPHTATHCNTLQHSGLANTRGVAKVMHWFRDRHRDKHRETANETDINRNGDRKKEMATERNTRRQAEREGERHKEKECVALRVALRVVVCCSLLQSVFRVSAHKSVAMCVAV